MIADDEIAENVNYALKTRYVNALLSDLPDVGGYRPAVLQGDLPTLATELRGGVFMLLVEREPEQDARTKP